MLGKTKQTAKANPNNYQKQRVEVKKGENESMAKPKQIKQKKVKQG